MKYLLFFPVFITFLLGIDPPKILAASNQFISIVNPVRVSTYDRDLKNNIDAQYAEVLKRSLSATWLLTYDVLLDQRVVAVLKGMDKQQELGIFLEVTPTVALDADFVYNKTDSWHRANSVLTTGYTQADRRRFIDKTFEKFKEVFGDYPTSVGAWWIDSYSLEYMKEKYNITANLVVTDQFSTDGYQIWGLYWSIPFYPSKNHAGMPSQNQDNMLDVVTTQWAARDPLNGYGRARESLYSTQDYFTISLNDDYFEKLLKLYGEKHKNKFGQITIGLEGDLSPWAYQTTFARQIEIAKNLEKQGIFSIVTMKDFSSWYRSNFPESSPTHIIETDDLLGKNVKTIWYQSPNYRINIIYNYDTRETKVRDFRTYHNNFQEPYYISPNKDLNLSLVLPSQLDSAMNPEEEWLVQSSELIYVINTGEELTLNYKNGNQIKLTSKDLFLKGKIRLPDSISKSPSVNIENHRDNKIIKTKNEWIYSEKGLIFRDLTQEGTYFLKQKKIILGGVFIVVVLIFLTLFLNKKRLRRHIRIIILAVLIIPIIGLTYYWYLSNSRMYFVSQSELDALNRLKTMKGSKVVLYDKVCLQCSWTTPIMPAIFANKRHYVKDVTGKEIIYNSSIFNAKTRPEAKAELDKLKADYIYLVKFEDYKEFAPFSPGDLDIEEIYSNANAQIWKVKH